MMASNSSMTGRLSGQFIYESANLRSRHCGMVLAATRKHNASNPEVLGGWAGFVYSSIRLFVHPFQLMNNSRMSFCPRPHQGCNPIFILNSDIGTAS